MVEHLSIRELKTFLSEHGVSLLGIAEKSELVALARTTQEQNAKSSVALSARNPKPSEGDTFLIAPGVSVHWLSVAERTQIYDADWKRDPESSVELFQGEEFLATKPKWRIEGYDSLADAVQICTEDAFDEVELARDVPGWEVEGYASLEEAMMDQCDAKTPEEATFDELGIPRLRCVDEDGGRQLELAGWEYAGHKPGRCFVLCENSVQAGTRVVECKGEFWNETDLSSHLMREWQSRLANQPQEEEARREKQRKEEEARCEKQRKEEEARLEKQRREEEARRYKHRKEEEAQRYYQHREAELAEAVRMAEAREASMTPEEKLEAEKQSWKQHDAAVDRSCREWTKMVSLPTLTNRGDLGPSDPQTPEVHARIHAGLDTPEIWAVSFTEIQRGKMWVITMVIEHIGARHDGMQMKGKSVSLMCRTRPTARDVLAVVWSAATEPDGAELTGPPHKPMQLFIAYRLAHAFEEIQAAMFTCRIACQLEEEADARASAAAHGMDYLGRNAPKPNCNAPESSDVPQTSCHGCGRQAAQCSLKRCAACETVWYCSRECQASDWKKHKPICTKGKSKTPLHVGDVD
jgi:hypothetical protein